LHLVGDLFELYDVARTNFKFMVTLLVVGFRCVSLLGHTFNGEERRVCANSVPIAVQRLSYQNVAKSILLQLQRLLLLPPPPVVTDEVSQRSSIACRLPIQNTQEVVP
jgi:hypothetical protein